MPGVRAGTSIRRLLVALTIAPVTGVLVLAGVDVHADAVAVDRASEIESLVRAAMRVDAARTSLTAELMPDIALAITRRPSLMRRLQLSTAEVPITPAAVQIFAETTDQALEAIDEDTTGIAVRSLRDRLHSVRGAIATGRDLIGGYRKAEKLVRTLVGIENRLLARAGALHPDALTMQALDDVRLLARTVQQAGQETPSFFEHATGYLTDGRILARHGDWIEVHHRFGSLSSLVAVTGKPSVASAWRDAESSPDAASVRRALDRAERPRSKPTNSDLSVLLFADSTRLVSYGTVMHVAAERAVAAAAEYRDHSRGHLLGAAALALVVALVSLACVWFVGRAMTRPLDALAAQATRVGDGELDDVVESGPREVRTVARGLAAAVGTLRKIQEQTAAVASGDLGSTVLHEPLPGALGTVVHASVTSMVQAIREREELRDDLARRASHDSLTGLLNRAGTMSLLGEVLEHARAGEVALLFVDLDYFKRANDTFGHRAGDEVLRRVASRLRGAVRPQDTVARLGGDEFVVVVRNLTVDEACRMADRVVEAIAAPFDIEDGQVLIGASVGVSFFDGTRDDGERLLVEADAAAYRAKSAGRGRAQVYDDHLREGLARLTELATAIETGLQRGEFLVHYQPIVDLASGHELGFEALIRWERPGHGLVPPNEFIPVAESSALINDLGRWVLHEAAMQLGEWTRQSSDVADRTMAVNVSGRHLLSRRIVDDVRDALTAAGIEPHRLTIEVTETVLIDDRQAVQNMRALRELGVRIAIDDFGTGFTSIGQLYRLPVDSLKIDRSFVCSADPAHVELVRLMVSAAHAYGLDVVAEGVESLHQADTMRTMDVDRAQGFLFARPSPPQALAAPVDVAG